MLDFITPYFWVGLIYKDVSILKGASIRENRQIYIWKSNNYYCIIHQMKMPFGKFFGRKEEEEDIDIDIEDYLNELSMREGKIIEREDITYVKPIDMDKEGQSIDEVVNELKKNNIVVLNVRALMHDKILLRDIVNRLRDVCMEMDGDIGRISSEKVLLVPAGMRIIHRSSM